MYFYVKAATVLQYAPCKEHKNNNVNKCVRVVLRSVDLRST